MKIQLKSDLHWEHDVHATKLVLSPEQDSNYVSPEAEVLVLAGDMINATDSNVDYLLWKFKDVKIPIFYVPGNHEYWHQSFLYVREYLEKKLAGTNIILLDRDSIIYKDTVFIGATLWTSLHDPMKALIAKQSRDFQTIKDLTVNYWHNRHIDDISYVEKVLNYHVDSGLKKVVINHYLPSYRSVPERFKGDAGNCIFVAEDMERVIAEYQPELVLHGHTHDSNDYLLGETRVVSNPKGRWYGDFNGLNAKYNNALIIEI